MDQKSWLWKKRPSENTIVAKGQPDIPPKAEDDEVTPNEKEVALQGTLEVLNEKLASTLEESNAKDQLVADHLKKTEEALAGKEKAEAEVLRLKQVVNEALQGEAAANESISHLNAALKDCMQQLNSVRQDQEQRVRDAVIATSKELDKGHKKLEERLTMMTKRITNLTAENSSLNKALFERELLIEDLSKFKSQAKEEFDTLMARLDSTGKENAFLRYEFRMLEKEFDLQNEDRNFTRYSLEASHKQYLESVKKIKKLEAECQRLRILVRRRLPGPAALVKMTREVNLQHGNQTQTRPRKLDSVSGSLIQRDGTAEPLPDKTSKSISFLVECLRQIEDENKILREALMHRDGDAGYSKFAVSKPSMAESKLAELCKSQGPKASLRTGYQTGKHTRLLSSGSSASSSLSDLEHFKHGDVKNPSDSRLLGITDMNLMDDFVEMEKLAIVSVDSQVPSSPTSSNVSGSLIASSTPANISPTSKELVPLGQNEITDKDHEHQTPDFPMRSSHDWLQHILNAIWEEKRVSGRSLEELLADIAMALYDKNRIQRSEDGKQASAMDPGLEKLPVNGLLTWKSPVTSPRGTTVEVTPDNGNLMEKAEYKVVQSNLHQSIRKIMDLVRSFGPKFPEDLSSSTPRGEQPSTSLDYIIHAFRWKRGEYAAVLKEFIDICDSLMDGKANFEKFAEVLASGLSCIVKSCVSHEGTSRVRNDLRKLFNADGSKAEPEIGSNENLLIELENVNNILRVQNKGCEIELNKANDKNSALTDELEQSKAELRTLQESQRMMEDQIENLKSINEDLDTQLTVAKSKLNEALQKLSSLEVEFENKSQCCEELEGTCLELQLQLESITGMETQNDNRGQEVKVLQTGWEITTATAKLDECQATIDKLGKQLKELASSNTAIPSDKILCVSSPDADTKLNKRLSLLDRMQFEDSNDQADHPESPTTKEIISTTEIKKSFVLQPDSSKTLHFPGAAVVTPDIRSGLKQEVGALAIVPSKKRGGGFSFLKKLLLRKKNGSKRKTSFYLTA